MKSSGPLSASLLLLVPVPSWGEAEPAARTGVGAADVLQVALGLALILVFIVVLAWLSRRWMRIAPGGAGQIRVLGGLAMGAKDRIVLLEVGDTQLLIGVSPGQMRTLHVLDQPLEVPETPASKQGKSFSQQLGRLLAYGPANSRRG